MSLASGSGKEVVRTLEQGRLVDNFGRAVQHVR